MMMLYNLLRNVRSQSLVSCTCKIDELVQVANSTGYALYDNLRWVFFLFMSISVA